MTKEMTPEKMLWDITLKAKEVNDVRKKAYQELTKKSAEYYIEKANHTISDNVQALKSQPLRDAEVTLIMEQLDITREYGMARLYAGEIEKDWEMLEFIAKNCRALIYGKSGKGTSEE